MAEIQQDLPLEPKVTDADLNVLRDQIKKSDAARDVAEKQLTEERRLRQETTNKLGNEINQKFAAQESAIENAIVASTAEIDGLEKQQSTLMEEGKFSEASKISRLIASAQYRLDGATQSKNQLETYKANAVVEAERARTTPADPLAGYSDPAKRWIKDHPEFMSDRRYNAKVMSAHNMAVANEVALDSPEYFKMLDEAVTSPKTRTQDAETDDVEDEVDEQEQPVKVEIKKNGAMSGASQIQREAPKSSTAAPVSRGTTQSNSGAGNSRRIQLSADEAEAAIISFPNIKPEEAYVRYANNKKKLKEAGKLN